MLTAVVLTRNEASSIEKCLSSLAFCSNILLVDDNSTDQTLELAKKYHPRVVKHSLNRDFAAQRNWALTQVKTPWTLFVDADEIVSSELSSEIISSINNMQYNGFYIPRKEYMWGQSLNHGDVNNKTILRLAKTSYGTWQGKVHETWLVPGPTSTLHNSLIHLPHPNLKSFIQHINFYSDLRSQELFQQNINTSLMQIIFYPVAKFINCYVLRLGFLDGTAGFIHAMIMTFYSFLVRSKLWMKNHV